MFKSKHFIVALLIAPVLAIIAYFGTDAAVSEKPHAAKEGESYKLASKSNCRYTSGLCNMENGDFKVQFRSEGIKDGQLTLSLKSDLPLEGAKIAIIDSPDEKKAPKQMRQVDTQNWHLTLNAPQNDESQLLMVFQANSTLYYGEANTQFVVYETLFTDKDN
ncbi:hypothetical protein TUMSATVNIG1_02090 [Vibrio nigripulchritudo]|uniref:hypothetical protein n=1 Tax=Vibrio nigripulchritudo TaxID=28173 RepID=UPI00190A9AE2|nr:hypothetical protein [Vibrio nigripulchritudo]BCL68272.1 hypothetical protein VNTUMSATTG_02090 [Vibrio nigripulchritudo]BDU29600.1 hypothetical protein TUMSATVNIG1_02090 [Vibrio nigripulchritudo]